MASINYDNRYFVGKINYDSGDFTREVVFRYRQKDRVVWGSFEGGRVLHGNFVAKVLDDDSLDMVWQYLNKDGVLRRGTCRSQPEVLPDGRLRLNESWECTGDDGESGTSTIEEIGG
ncbi:MAG: n-acetylglutamate synthase [candidate division Zixibacteria bacterium]